MGVDSAERDPQNEHVASEIADRPQHAPEAAAMEQHPVGGGDGVGQGDDRGGHLGTVGLQRRGVFRGSASNRTRGDDPERGRAGRQQREQQVALARKDADRQPEAEDDQRQRTDGGVEEAEVELAFGDRLRRHPEVAQDPRAHPYARERAAGQDHSAAELGSPSLSTAGG
jgi:hypothetical protein